MPVSSTIATLATDMACARRYAERLAETDGEPLSAAAYAEGAGWTLAVYAQQPADALRRAIAERLGADVAAHFTIAAVADADWVGASLRGLAPVRVDRFVVHGAHDRQRVPPNRIGIEIEAALAFGTGHHGTTRGCLFALGRLARRRKPRRILDIGTGSGILAIAAARLLRRPVLAGDIDPQAVATARANARLNRAGAAIGFVTAAGLRAARFRAQAPYDLVFANILLEPLQALAHPLARLLAPGGRAVLSGLLPEQAAAAVAAYRAQGLVLERRRDLCGWTTLVMRRARRK